MCASTVSTLSPSEPAIVVRQAVEEDWEGVKGVVRRLNSSRFSAYLTCTEDEARNWLRNSLQWPQQIGLVTVLWQGHHCGLAALMAMDVPQPGVLGVSKGPRHAFIHSCYIDPYLTLRRSCDTAEDYSLPVPPSVGHSMCRAICDWALAHGANYVYGNCRNDMPFAGLLKKHGFEQIHVVVGRELKEASC